MAADQSPSNSNAIATSSNSGLRSDHVDFVVFCETSIDKKILPRKRKCAMAAQQRTSTSNAVARSPTASNSNLESDPDMDFLVYCKIERCKNMAVCVKYNDTVRALKALNDAEKIMSEYYAIFKEEEIFVYGVEVEREEDFYHLSDSILVRKIFEGDTGRRFLQIHSKEA